MKKKIVTTQAVDKLKSLDFLDEVIAKRALKNPEFPKLVEKALLERRAARGRKS